MTYSTDYLREVTEITSRLDADAIERMADELVSLRERNGRLFIVGSGGGAGHASHAVNDFRKIAGIESYTPTDNVSELTARINDEGWETSYIESLRVSRLGQRDALLVFSVGGGDIPRNISLNLVRCVEYARSVGARVLGVVGRDGGLTAKLADAVVVVPMVNPENVTAHTEGFQAVIWHLLVSHPRIRLRAMRWESVR